jgi:hypothetical protein
MTGWILIIWVSSHQLAIGGYASLSDCLDAAQMARQEVDVNRRHDAGLVHLSKPNTYCIPGPSK